LFLFLSANHFINIKFKITNF